MRITAGTCSRRRIRVPKTLVRPTQDMVRQALFNILGNRVMGKRFLDLFAGSGSVGLEAGSRGAGHVVWVENEKRAVNCLKKNLRDLPELKGDVVLQDVQSFLKSFHGQKSFDIVFADPPYAEREWPVELLGLLSADSRLSAGGMFVVETSRKVGTFTDERWRLVDQRKYGRALLSFFQRT